MTHAHPSAAAPAGARPAALTALLAALVIAAGCNIIVPVAYLIEGPASNDAVFTLPGEKRTVVFVDDTRNDLPRTSLRTIIGDTVVTTLLDRSLVTQAIDSTDAMQVARRRDTDSKRLSIAEIGEEVGAEIVIYVKIDAFALTPDGVVPRPVGAAQVKVLDIGAGVRLFPEGGASEGFPVQTQLTEQDLDLYKSSAGRRQLEDALAKEMGRDIAKLFYKHEKKELGGRLGVR